MATAWQDLTWTKWCPLDTAGRDRVIPPLPGLYRIRRVGRTELDYIGQTGVRLRSRLGMLSGVLADVMPYRDPHTAAPALWALRHATQCNFEVSAAVVEGTTAWRKGLEAVAIAVYRQERRCSPTVEFGRMPTGYRASTGNNSKLVAAGARYRGGIWTEPEHSHVLGIPPVGALTGDPQAERWGGHAWSGWVPLAVGRGIPSGVGLYRLRGDDPEMLLYVGQGGVPSRPLAHLAKVHRFDHVQGRIFAAQTRFEVSWVLNAAWQSHHRLELEGDLLAAHVLTTGAVPTAQFLG